MACNYSIKMCKQQNLSQYTKCRNFLRKTDLIHQNREPRNFSCFILYLSCRNKSLYQQIFKQIVGVNSCKLTPTWIICRIFCSNCHCRKFSKLYSRDYCCQRHVKRWSNYMFLWSYSAVLSQLLSFYNLLLIYIIILRRLTFILKSRFYLDIILYVIQFLYLLGNV